ncbi:MAG: hypothetical protein QE271_09965 [Bacteriovoracaceae bacterium]|nr:hypothetical protein [Bacteriovoracaceae bacterium]
MKINPSTKLGLILGILLYSLQILASEKIYLIKNETLSSTFVRTTRFYVVEKTFDGSTVYQFERSYGKLQKLVGIQKFTSGESLSKLNENHEQTYALLDWDLEFETFVPFDSPTLPTVLWPNRNQWNDPARDWEKEFGTFVSEVSLNLFYDLGLAIDCADVVYGLRWIFARMNFLPMNFTVSGGRKMNNSRFPKEWLALNTSDRLKKSWREDKVFLKSLRYMMDVTYTSTMPFDTDLLRPQVENIRPGVINYWGSHSQFVQKVDSSGENVPVTVIETSVPKILKPLNQYLIFDPKNFRQFRPNGIRSELKIQKPQLDPDSHLDSDAMFGGYTEMAAMVVDKNLLKKNVSKIKQSFHLTLQTMLDQRSLAISLAQKECEANPLSCTFGSSNFENYSTPSRDQRISDTFAYMQFFLQWINPSENMGNPDLFISLGNEKVSLDFVTFVQNINESLVSFVPFDPVMLRWGYSLKSQNQEASDNAIYLKSLDSLYKTKFIFEQSFATTPSKSTLFSLRHLSLSSQKIAYHWMNSCLSNLSDINHTHATCFQDLVDSGFEEFNFDPQLNSPKIKSKFLPIQREQGLILKNEETVFESKYFLVIGGRWVYRKADMKMFDLWEPLYQAALSTPINEDGNQAEQFNDYIKQSGEFHTSLEGIYFSDANQRFCPFVIDLSDPQAPQVVPLGVEVAIFDEKIVSIDETQNKIYFYRWNRGLFFDSEKKVDHVLMLKDLKREFHKMMFVQYQGDKTLHVFSSYGERTLPPFEEFWKADFTNFFINASGDLYFSSSSPTSTFLYRAKSFVSSMTNSQDALEQIVISDRESLSLKLFLSEKFVIFDNQVFQLSWGAPEANSQPIGMYRPINEIASTSKRFLLQSLSKVGRFLLLDSQTIFNRKLPFIAPEVSEYSFNGEELDIYYTREQDEALITKSVNKEFAPIIPWPRGNNLQLLDHKTVDTNYSQFRIVPGPSQPVDQILLREQMPNLGGHGFLEQKFSLSGRFQKGSIFEASSSQAVDDFCEAKNFENERVHLKTYQLSRLCGDLFFLTPLQ